MRGRKESTKQEAAWTLLSISASTIIDDTKDIVGTEKSTSIGKKDDREIIIGRYQDQSDTNRINI